MLALPLLVAWVLAHDVTHAFTAYLCAVFATRFDGWGDFHGRFKRLEEVVA